MPMSPEVAALVQAAAERHGLSWRHPDYLPRIAQIESSGNPGAYNKSGAAGLFQFIPSTAQAFGLSNPYDPAAASDAAARLTLANQKKLTGALGREPTDGELYLAHQQGGGGATRILANPDATMGELGLGKAASSNGGGPDMLARDFGAKWINRVDGMPSAPAPSAPGGQPLTMPGSTGAPAAFGLAGPMQVSAAEPAAGSDGTLKTLASLLGDGGQGKQQQGGGQSQGDGGSILRAAPPRPRAFGFMRFG